MSFSPDLLAAILARCPVPRRYWVAFSGGLDSSALLHAMAALRPQLCESEVRAVHVDHGISPASGSWSEHCRSICESLKVPYRGLRTEVHPAPGESLEAAARHARYRALGEIIGEEEALLTAHHQDDQAETLLLQLLRGAGPVGLAAMPEIAPFGRGWLLRPLLRFTRAELLAYAELHDLRWIDDDSNFDLGLDRNYLRRQVMPLLHERWPGCSRTLARSASHLAESARLLEELAQIDLEQMQGPAPDTLSVKRLGELSAPRRHNVVRFWLRGLGLPVPSAARLKQVVADLVGAALDRNPSAAWAAAELYRYRGLVYAMPALIEHDRLRVIPWDITMPLVLSGGVLEALPVTGRGLSAEAAQVLPVTVRFRRGGERCKPAGSSHTRSLKTLFQEHGIPPWQRDRVPLVYMGDELAAVSHLWVCQPFAAKAGEQGWELRWRI